MKCFTINDLELYSGIKAHTLRIWERRYAFIQPARSSGNFRTYTLDELKLILNIALLKRQGYRISALAKNSFTDIEHHVEVLEEEEIEWQKAINQITICMYGLQPESVEQLLDNLFVKFPITILIEKILVPFLNTTGLFWKGHKLMEEHFAVTAIRKKLIFAIQTCPPNSIKNNTVLLFLPDNKQLDLGLLYANYYLKCSGANVLYMGSDVSVDNLKNIFKVTPVKFLFTYLPTIHSFNLQELLIHINQFAPQAQLVIGKYCKKEHKEVKKNQILYMEFSQALHFLNRSILQ